jgi:hypothetical protein
VVRDSAACISVVRPREALGIAEEGAELLLINCVGRDGRVGLARMRVRGQIVVIPPSRRSLIRRKGM